MNIFFRELRASLRSVLIWGGVSILLIAVAVSKFSAYEGNPEILEVLNTMPPAMLEAFRMNAFDLTTITGFYGVLFIYFALIVTISAAMWGSDVITKEERDKTAEFTLVLPVTRQKLITAKILAAMVDCIILLLIILGATLVAVAQYAPDDAFYEFLALSMVALFIIQMIFLAVGFFLGCSMRHYKRAGAVALTILLGTYFLSIISSMNENLEFLKYFSPFTYFDPAVILNESSLEIGYVLLSLAIIAALVTGGYITYARRDLYV